MAGTSPAMTKKRGLSNKPELRPFPLRQLWNRLRDDDFLIITADHGCDPTWSGTDHTREQVPILAWSPRSTSSIGKRAGFADIGAAVARHLELRAPGHGVHF